MQALASKMGRKPIVTYGANPQADVRFTDIRAEGTRTVFDITIRDRRTGGVTKMENLMLPMPGQHNVANATAAIAIAHRLGIGEESIRTGLADFKGVGRRFTHTGSWKGVEIYDDYAHHPVEITAVLKAARQAVRGNRSSRVIAIKQPHRYSRLEELFDGFTSCFNDADTVLVAPVYAAGEVPKPGVSSRALVDGLRAGGHRDARLIDGPDDVAPIIAEIAKDGDIVIFCGAGDVTRWAHALPDELAKTA